MSYAVFGYGSIILPHSFVRRLTDEVNVEEIFAEERRQRLGNVLLDKEVDVWQKQFAGRFEFIPVRVPGFVRAYTLESKHGGAKLQAYYTGRDEDFMNGVIVSGLSCSEYEDVTESEPNYREATIPKEDLEFYNPSHEEKVCADQFTIYLPDSERSVWETEQLRNQTYHARVLKGIELLGEMHGDAIGEKFLAEFYESTYELPSQVLDVEPMNDKAT